MYVYCRSDRISREKYLEKPEAAQTLIIMKLTFAIALTLTHTHTHVYTRENVIKDK